MLKKFSVKPNQVGFLYKSNRFYKKLESGIYSFFDPFFKLTLFCLPLTTKLLTVVNQEVLSKDNIALRFSYCIEYKINDGEKFLANFELNKNVYALVFESENIIHTLSQISMRDKIARVSIEDLNEHRDKLFETVKIEIQSKFDKYGIEIVNVLLKDITFPKNIQEVFSRQLEAKVRSKSDLENARTAVATSRALKNASEIIKDDENIKYLQFLETITKIASKGNHTFVIGDLKNKKLMTDN